VVGDAVQAGQEVSGTGTIEGILVADLAVQV